MNQQSTNGQARPDRETYLNNRYGFPLEELARYGDQWVAWTLDGSKIVAHHADLAGVEQALTAAGVGSEDVVVEWIPPGGEVDLVCGSYAGKYGSQGETHV